MIWPGEWPWQKMIGMPLYVVGKKGIRGNKYRKFCKRLIAGGKCKTKTNVRQM